MHVIHATKDSSMKKLLFALSLLSLTSLSLNAETEATPCHCNQAILKKVDDSNKKLNKILKSLKEQAENDLLLKSASKEEVVKEEVKNHPCTDFATGKKSYSTRVIVDTFKSLIAYFAFTMTKEESPSAKTQLALAVYPLFHDIVHHEASALKTKKGIWKFLISNWSDLGLAALICAISTKNPDLSGAQIINYIVAAIYAKGLFVIAADKLKLADRKIPLI